MDIITVNFEEPVKIIVHGESVFLTAFKTIEHGNIKFGIKASRSIKVHREEVYQAIQLQELQEKQSDLP